MTDSDVVARLREAWPAGVPRLSPTSNRLLAFVNTRPEGTRAADVLPLLLDAGEPLPDRDSDRYVKVASKAKTYLRRLAESGRIACVAVGLYRPQDRPQGTPAPHDDPRTRGQVMKPTGMEDPETGDGHEGTGTGAPHGTARPHGNPMQPTVMTDANSGDGHDSDTADDAARWLLDLAGPMEPPSSDQPIEPTHEGNGHVNDHED